MFKGLLIDAVVHLRECMTLNAVLFVSGAAGVCVLRKTGKKTDARVKALMLLACISFVLLLIPVSASIIRLAFGTYYDAPDIWGIIPLVPLGAICFSALAGESVGFFNKEKKSTVLLGLALITGAVLLCGSLGTPREQGTARCESASVGETEVARYIADCYGEADGPVVLVANDDITAAVHGLSADIVTLYGRDMWDGRLTKNRYGTYSDEIRELRGNLLKMEDNKFWQAPDVCRQAFAQGADIVVVPGACDPADFDTEGLIYKEFTASSGEMYYLVYSGEL